MRTPYPSGITREQFEIIRHALESSKQAARPREIDAYDIFCAILYRKREGCRWRSGLPHAMFVTTANVTDRDGAISMIGYAASDLSKCLKVLLDGGYTGEKFAGSVKGLIGADVEAVKRNGLHKFVVLPKRWIVECSFGWLEDYRLLWKNCERKLHSTLQAIKLAFISLLLRRY